ncbi:unnamed protein product, partial [Urochloa humidicola]
SQTRLPERPSLSLLPPSLPLPPLPDSDRVEAAPSSLTPNLLHACLASMSPPWIQVMRDAMNGIHGPRMDPACAVGARRAPTAAALGGLL